MLVFTRGSYKFDHPANSSASWTSKHGEYSSAPDWIKETRMFKMLIAENIEKGTNTRIAVVENSKDEKGILTMMDNKKLLSNNPDGNLGDITEAEVEAEIEVNKEKRNGGENEPATKEEVVEHINKKNKRK